MSRSEHHQPQYPGRCGNFRFSYHREMVSDSTRTNAIFSALRKTLTPDTLFVELGCGTGLFSLYAAGICKEVVAIEMDPAIAEVARKNFAIKKASNVELIVADALTVPLPKERKADVILCEMISTWLVEEPQLPVINRAREDLLAPDGIIVPSKFVNLVELGYFDFEDQGIEFRTALPLFTGLRQPTIATNSAVAKHLDFSKHVGSDLSCEAELSAHANININCARLTSFIQFAEGIGFSGTDSLVPPIVVPLERDKYVHAGDKIRFHAEVEAWTDLTDASFWID